MFVNYGDQDTKHSLLAKHIMSCHTHFEFERVRGAALPLQNTVVKLVHSLLPRPDTPGGKETGAAKVSKNLIWLCLLLKSPPPHL